MKLTPRLPAMFCASLVLGAALLLSLAAVSARADSLGPVHVFKERILVLQGAIERAALTSSDLVYPEVAMVRRGGGLHATIWPRDPWTGEPMSPGTRIGHYTYTRATDGRSYSLTGHYRDGDFIVRGAIPQALLDARLSVATLTGLLDTARADLATAQDDLAQTLIRLADMTDQLDVFRDAQTREGVLQIKRLVEAFAFERNGSALPWLEQVTEGMIAPGPVSDPAKAWPRDPFHPGSPMTQGTAPGQFTYEGDDRGGSFVLTYTLHGHLSDGSDYVLARGSLWPEPAGPPPDPPPVDDVATKDELTIANGRLLQLYLDHYAAAHDGLYPEGPDVDRFGALGDFLVDEEGREDIWPTNAFSGWDMVDSDSPGDFRYYASDDRRWCTLYAVMSDSSTKNLEADTRVTWTRMFEAENAERDERTRLGAMTIQAYIEYWAECHDGRYPEEYQVGAAQELGTWLTSWPDNPWESPGTAMVDSETQLGDYDYGDFDYSVEDAGTGVPGDYSLVAHLSTGDVDLRAGAETSLQKVFDARTAERDALTKLGGIAIQQGIELYALTNAGLYPEEYDVAANGAVGMLMPYWPHNPWNPVTDMTEGDDGPAGSFDYEPLVDGSGRRTGYRLTVWLGGDIGFDVYDGEHGTVWGDSQGSHPWMLSSVRRAATFPLALQGAGTIAEYVEQWATEHGGVYPAVGQVSRTGAVGQVHGFWPLNYVNSGPMAPTDGLSGRGDFGNYRYSVATDGMSYTLTVYGEDSSGDSIALTTIDSASRDIWGPGLGW
jgi:hypothetical protein